MARRHDTRAGAGPGMIGLDEARRLVEQRIRPLSPERVPLVAAVGRVLSGRVVARVDSPGADVSLKDGYAVRAAATAGATRSRPVCLPVTGTRFAGQKAVREGVPRGCSVRITTGAILPVGTDAVVAEEHCTEALDGIQIHGPVEPGSNVLARGEDIREGSVLGMPGERLTPGKIGSMAAAGLDQVAVHRLPGVCLVATGDEVVAPGMPLRRGQIYASNLFVVAAWLRAFGIRPALHIVRDRAEPLRRWFARAIQERDALLTTGGAWGSERDLVLRVLDELGWDQVFHRVRLGPGKAVGFGLLHGRPVFCLPGGPPSNEMAFLQVALPGILRLAGWEGPPFPVLTARLTEPVEGRRVDWTQVKRGRLRQARDGTFLVIPDKARSRLESMALAECLIPVPEGVARLEAGQRVRVQVLRAPLGGWDARATEPG